MSTLVFLQFRILKIRDFSGGCRRNPFLGGPFLNLIEFIIDPGELHMRRPLPSAHRRESVLSEMPNMEARYALLTYGWPPISIWLFASWEGERLASGSACPIGPSSAPNACVSAVAAEAPPSAAETGAIVRGGSALWVTGGSAGCETSSRRRHLPGFSSSHRFRCPSARM